MTPISDIENLERLLAEEKTGLASVTGFIHAFCKIAPSLIADWKAMRGEIERLTKERDGVLSLSKATHLGIQDAVNEAYERAAKVCEGIGKDIVCPEECAEAIRAMKAKEE